MGIKNSVAYGTCKGAHIKNQNVGKSSTGKNIVSIVDKQAEGKQAISEKARLEQYHRNTGQLGIESGSIPICEEILKVVLIFITEHIFHDMQSG